MRPVTAIRNAANDGNPDTEADPTWTPLLTTPGHPSYSSGHSSVSAAAATVLGDFFCDDSIAFTDTNELSAGGATVTRSFDGFWEAAEEAANSRLYGGIHWRFDNEVGLETGREIGGFVANHLLQPRGGGHHRGGDDGDGQGHGAPPPFCDRGPDERGHVSFFDEDDADGSRSLLTCER